MIFSFGQSEQERIEIDVLSYEREPLGDFYDDNWLIVETRVWVGGFQGKVGATFITSELVKFASELRLLFNTLKGTAEFSTMEGQLLLRLTGDGKGHIEIFGEILDRAGVGNNLHFALHIDQTQLEISLRELEGVIFRFPIRGKEEAAT